MYKRPLYFGSEWSTETFDTILNTPHTPQTPKCSRAMPCQRVRALGNPGHSNKVSEEAAVVELPNRPPGLVCLAFLPLSVAVYE